MSDRPLEPAQQLVNRQQIHDCILRYCSGVDHFDRAMVSVYHADAIDDHGAFVGSAAASTGRSASPTRSTSTGHKHYVLNHRCGACRRQQRGHVPTGCSRQTTEWGRPPRCTAGATSIASKSTAIAGPSRRANASSNGAVGGDCDAGRRARLRGLRRRLTRRRRPVPFDRST